jgi:hypothetical protein
MEAPAENSDMPAPPAGFVAVTESRRTEYLLDALKMALHEPGEHRLFRAGKLAGLFPARTGPAGEAALLAVRDGLLETVRTEAKGRVITEWVCATPKAVSYIHQHDSPRSILRELKEVLNATQAGVPVFLAEARAELATLSANFESRASAMLARLDDLATRCEAALRRAETKLPAVTESTAKLVPWALEALEYLDRRNETGIKTPCLLPELFHALRTRFATLSLPDFHDGMKRLHDMRAVQLQTANEMSEPEYAIVAEGKLMYAVTR